MFYKKENKVQYQINNKINPITIVGLIILFSIILTIGNQIDYVLVLAISMICLAVFSLKKAIRSLIMILVILGLLYIINPYLGNVFLGSIYTMLIIILKYSPIFILGKIIASYSSSYLMSALRKVGISGGINIGVTIFFRFLPEIALRIKEINNGLKIRGFRVSIFNPVKSFELYFVPLLYKCIDVSDTLTCSIISKGMEYNCDKTSYHSIKFTEFDIIICLLGVVLLGVNVWNQF